MVDRLAVLDNIPTRVVFNATDAKLAKLYWFFYFQQVPHLPEALIEGRQGMFEVFAGDPVPGLGRVDAIRRQDGRWVVVTTKGLIVAR